MSFRNALWCVLIMLAPAPLAAQMSHDHEMFTTTFSSGWRISGMAQLFPIFTGARSSSGDTPIDQSDAYLTQGAAMINLESPSRRLVLRVTPNVEGLTQEDGELTLGGWGEGFIDSRHPHTLVHEAMVSLNFFDGEGGGFSVSAGKGFAPYGTDDPMSRPSVKYPTNHHLSQILERFTLNAVWMKGPWGVEAGLFGGAEPDGPYDFSNIDSFGDSFSTRLSRRFSPRAMGEWDAELSASYGRVSESHEGEDAHIMQLYNGALRLDVPTETGALYALAEYSWSDPDEDEGYWSLLTEAQWSTGRHTPYLRWERAIRPEFPRDDVAGDDFFRYDHDAEPLGASAWSILSLGYGYTATRGAVSVRPFVEGQIASAAGERGGFSAEEILGSDRFSVLTVGLRIFFGGDPMRMGSYGVRDPITAMGASMGSMPGMHMMR